MQEERREELEIVNAALLAEIEGHTELHHQFDSESSGNKAFSEIELQTGCNRLACNLQDREPKLDALRN